MPEETDYLLIDVAAARKSGVMPIAYRGKEEFKALERVPAVEAETATETVEEE